MPPQINILVEGDTDELVITRILEHLGYQIGLIKGGDGKSFAESKLTPYNQAAQYGMYWLAVVDLDNDAECAPTYIQQHLPEPAPRMCFRVAVREIEAWLLADREHLAAFLAISIDNIPQHPDQLDDPKQTLVNLVRRCTNTSLKKLMVPEEGTKGVVGVGYTTGIAEFVMHKAHPWRPDAAAEHSDSLQRCLRALRRWDD